MWGVLLAVTAFAIGAAATSPLLEWRDPVYIAAGLFGVVAMAFLAIQPLLAAGRLRGLSLQRSRRIHRLMGAALVAAVILHVAGLWITSPPDMIDALTFTSPTPFSNWGVIAMWAVFVAALLALCRRRVGLRVFRIAHTALVVLVVITSCIHALLIEGTMETVSKVILCVFVLLVTAKVVIERRVWVKRRAVRE